MKPLEPGVAILANALKLKYKNFYLGISDGDFTTEYPHARLLYSLGGSPEENSFVDDGTGRIVMERGQWLLLPPFLKIFHHHRKNRHLSIHFSFSILRGMEVFSGLKQIRRGNAFELLPVVESMEQTKDDNSVLFSAGAEVVLRKVLFSLMAEMDTQQIMKQCELVGSYHKLTDYLHARCDCRITVAEMARIMQLPEQRFARKFAADTGITPRKFNENIIIEHAVDLLCRSGLSLKEIADKLHFANEYYFSRFFKRSMKLPPGTFRKML